MTVIGCLQPGLTYASRNISVTIGPVEAPPSPPSPPSGGGSSSGGAGGLTAVNSSGDFAVVPVFTSGNIPSPVIVHTSVGVTFLPAESDVCVRGRATTSFTDIQAHVMAQAQAFLGVKISPDERDRYARFIKYGGSYRTCMYGEGERMALLLDGFETLGHPADLLAQMERLASGKFPTSKVMRHLPARKKQTQAVIAGLQQIKWVNTAPVTSAWLTAGILYRVRPVRYIAKERASIAQFTRVYHKIPTTPFDWAIVRSVAALTH